MTAAPYREPLEGFEHDESDVRRIAHVIAEQNNRRRGELDAVCYARIARAVLDEFHSYELVDPAWRDRPVDTVAVTGGLL